jgi:hypothetical protein
VRGGVELVVTSYDFHIIPVRGENMFWSTSEQRELIDVITGIDQYRGLRCASFSKSAITEKEAKTSALRPPNNS